MTVDCVNVKKIIIIEKNCKGILRCNLSILAVTVILTFLIISMQFSPCQWRTELTTSAGTNIYIQSGGHGIRA